MELRTSCLRFPLPDSRGCWPTGNVRSLQRVGADAMTLSLAAGWLLHCSAARILLLSVLSGRPRGPAPT